MNFITNMKRLPFILLVYLLAGPLTPLSAAQKPAGDKAAVKQLQNLHLAQCDFCGAHPQTLKTALKTEKKINSGDSCHVPKGKGHLHAVCMHCGCRLKYAKEDLDKQCTACKCGKKIKECISRKP